MTKFPEGDTHRIDIIGHLEEFRRRILMVIAAFVVFLAVGFYFRDSLMSMIMVPAGKAASDFIFIRPMEAFMSYLRCALLAGSVLTFPVLLYNVWRFIAPAFTVSSPFRAGMWMLSSLFLFLAGLSFVYFLVLPAALDFLLGFSGGRIKPSISVGEYVSFFTALTMAGGVVFQIPLVMGLAADMKIMNAAAMKSRRRYSIVAIMIFAAIITPTHDMLNMLIFAIPMMILYEVGIILASVVEKKHDRK